jgi:hypothetical protein
MVSKEDVQYNMGSESWCGPDVPPFPKMLSLTEMKASVC